MARKYTKKQLSQYNSNLFFLGGDTRQSGELNTEAMTSTIMNSVAPGSGALVSPVSQAGDSMGGVFGGAIKGSVNPFSATFNKDLKPWQRALGTVNPALGGIFNMVNKENKQASEVYNSELQQRNNMLGIKAMGGKLGFDKWYAKTSKTLDLNPNPDDPQHQYDYRGYHSKYGDVDMTKGEHFTDEYKLPGHPTFSNESKYSNSKTQGGSWNQMDDKSWMFEHSPFTYGHYNETGRYLDGTGENQSLPAIDIVGNKNKAMGGRMILPMGTSPNMMSEYENGGLIKDNGFSFKTSDGRVLKFLNKNIN